MRIIINFIKKTQNDMKKDIKKIVGIIGLVFLLYVIVKKDHVYYLPFNIPGNQMAITIPPFGMFIEGHLKGNDELVRHEQVHWSQYERMGFFTFYATYFKEYFTYGKKDKNITNNSYS